MKDIPTPEQEALVKRILDQRLAENRRWEEQMEHYREQAIKESEEREKNKPYIGFEVIRKKLAGPAATKAKKVAFLHHFSNSGNITLSSKMAGCSNSTPKAWLQSDEYFAAKYYEANDQAADLLEAEAFRRAVDGWDEPIYQRGELLGYVRKFDSKVLQMLLSGVRPNKYGRKTDVTVTDKREHSKEEEDRTEAWIDEVLGEVGKDQ